MKYLDTNILVRLITNDEPVQTQQALEWLRGGKDGEYMVLDAVLVEVCFVLEFQKYKMKRHDIALVLQAFLDLKQVSSSPASLGALHLYKDHPKLDFTDCLLIALGGKKDVLTFDKTLVKVAQSL